MEVQSIIQSAVFASTSAQGGTVREARISPPRTEESAPPPIASAIEREPVLPTASVFDAIYLALDLTSGGRDLIGTYNSMSAEDRGAFLSQLAGLLEQGVVGQETVELNGEPYTTFITTRLGDPELMHARAYRGGGDIPPRLDIRV